MAKQGGTFSAEEVRYLKRLPAVANVTRSRITYTESFKRESLKRYLAGESPVKLFREAGLDPALIGYKRIERSFSRWKERARQIGTRPDDERESADMERASAALFAPETRYASERPPRTRPLDFFGGGGIGLGDDVRALIIAQQARRIDELEHEVDALERRITVLTEAPDGVPRPECLPVLDGPFDRTVPGGSGSVDGVSEPGEPLPTGRG